MIKEDIVKTRIEAEGFKKVQTDILAIQKTLAEYSEEVKELKYQKSLLVAAGKTESDEYKNLTKRIKKLF